MPLQLWIVVAVLAAASPSFAKEAAPKGAVHSWTEKAEPAVVPVGEPELVPRSAFASDFPTIDTPPPVAAAPSRSDTATASAPAKEVAPLAAEPAKKDAPSIAAKIVEGVAGLVGKKTAVEPAAVKPVEELAAIAPAPAVVESPAVVEPAAVVDAPAVAEPAAVVESPGAAEPASDAEPAADAKPAAAVEQAAVVEPAAVEQEIGPYGAPASPVLPAADFVPRAVVEAPAAAAPVAEPIAKPAPKRERLPEVVTPKVYSGAAEKAAARAYLAAMQKRPDPYELASVRSGSGSSSTASSPATPESGVLPPKIIDIPRGEFSKPATPYGTPARRTADRQLLMREFPDELVERMWLQDWTDIERASEFGQLVDVPSDPDGRGIVLRLEGGSRIGELETDDYKQALLCRLTKPALGLLYRIAARMRQIEGPDYVPLEITSLVRTWDYQLRLTDVNPNADRTRDGVPPTHVLGMAFDIARTQMSYERQQRLEDVFEELGQAGELAYYKEGSHNGLMHYHVMALPSAEMQLARYYERDFHFREQAPVVYGERAKLPEAPCVTFGTSLEPFSAICSCELPLEVSAATIGGSGAPSATTPGAASAPISR